MKKKPTLLLLCLLISPFADAAPNFATTETTLPGSTEIQSSSVVNDANMKPGPAPGSTPETTPSAPAVTQSYPANKEVLQEVNSLTNYPLSPGDTLSISVWKEEGLQEQQYLISPDGTLIYPLVGTVIAAGKTTSELKEILTNKLADYISDPSITIRLMNNLGNTIFVIGKVNRPGQYSSSRKIDVLQALSLAGGLTVYASEGSISILRRLGNEVKVFPFDYSDVIHGDDLQQNILLEPGDTVTVP